MTSSSTPASSASTSITSGTATSSAHIDKVFGQLPTVKENSGAAPVRESTRKLQFSDTLPDSFDRKEYLRLAQILGIPTPSTDRYVKKWLAEGKLEKAEHGKYRKRGGMMLFYHEKIKSWPLTYQKTISLFIYC